MYVYILFIYICIHIVFEFGSQHRDLIVNPQQQDEDIPIQSGVFLIFSRFWNWLFPETGEDRFMTSAHIFGEQQGQTALLAAALVKAVQQDACDETCAGLRHFAT